MWGSWESWWLIITLHILNGFIKKIMVLSPSLLRFHVPVYPEIVDSITVFPWFGLRHGTYYVGAHAKIETLTKC